MHVLEAALEAGARPLSPSRHGSLLCCPETLTNPPEFLKPDHFAGLGSKKKGYILLLEFFITFQLYYSAT